MFRLLLCASVVLLAWFNYTQAGGAIDMYDTLFLHNNKSTVITCCQGARWAFDNSRGNRVCYRGDETIVDANLLCNNGKCNQRMKVVSVTWCAVEKNGDFNYATDEFNMDCVERQGGTIMPPRNNSCSFDNFRESVDPGPKKPAPPPPPHKQAPTGSGISINTTITPKPDQNPALPPAKTGSYRYTLVDYALTRAISCCDGADKPHPTFQEYTCHYQDKQTYANVFAEQCQDILKAWGVPGASGLLTEDSQQKVLQPRSLAEGDAATTPGTSNGGICSTALANIKAHRFGYCQLNFDVAEHRLVPYFEQACTDFNGMVTKPVQGTCMWESSKNPNGTSTSTGTDPK
ncbi:hypothetical protein ACQY0O_007701 [Thecaphora frezii]